MHLFTAEKDHFVENKNQKTTVIKNLSLNQNMLQSQKASCDFTRIMSFTRLFNYHHLWKEHWFYFCLVKILFAEF